MAYVFVSYASEDRPRIASLANALEEEGWSVWWDRTIPPGKSFDEVIEQALDAAGCVIVVWTESAVQSRWVKTEAEEGLRRGDNGLEECFTLGRRYGRTHRCGR